MTDLPLSGRVVELLVIARRFRCEAVLCGRKIFTERFADGILAPSARRTARLDSIVHHLGLALGGRPAAGFAKRLMLPVSKDTLLRVVRRRSRWADDSLKVIGIDDWAWRRYHRYGWIIFNRPKAYNALNRELAAQWLDALIRCDEDEGVRDSGGS